MANKTQPTDRPVAEFIASIDNSRRKADAEVLLPLMERASGERPIMWGDSIVGFGRYDYRYESGRSGQFFLTGFSPRKTEMVVYVIPGFDEFGALLGRLGPHRLGRSCLYIRRLETTDLDVLEALVRRSVETMRAKHGA